MVAPRSRKIEVWMYMVVGPKATFPREAGNSLHDQETKQRVWNIENVYKWYQSVIVKKLHGHNYYKNTKKTRLRVEKKKLAWKIGQFGIIYFFNVWVIWQL